MDCPHCGALNPDGAEWCSLCMRRFEEDQAVAEEAEPAAQPVSRETAPEHEAAWRAVQGAPGPGRPGTERGWVCAVCKETNDFPATVCSTCGESIFRTLKQVETGKPPPSDREPWLAAALSALPGLGHLYLERTAEGVARLILALWWLGSAFLLTGAPGLVAPIRILLILGVLALVIISGVEAYRAAEDHQAPPLLDRKALMYSSLGAVLLLAFGAVLALVAARGG